MLAMQTQASHDTKYPAHTPLHHKPTPSWSQAVYYMLVAVQPYCHVGVPLHFGHPLPLDPSVNRADQLRLRPSEH